MEYNHRDIESRWQQYWREHKTYATHTPTRRDPNIMCSICFPILRERASMWVTRWDI